REQFGLGEGFGERAAFRLRSALSRPFADAGHRLAQGRFGGTPIGENAEHAGIGRLTRQCRGVEHLVADNEAGARPFARLIGCKFVAGGFRHEPPPFNLDRDQTAIHPAWQRPANVPQHWDALELPPTQWLIHRQSKTKPQFGEKRRSRPGGWATPRSKRPIWSG